MDNKIAYILQIADNALIIGHRLSEWCGHGPVLEQDIALTNIALDHIGLARNLYQYAAEVEGNGKDEDHYPYKRDVTEWKNLLLCEVENGHFGHTILRQFLFDSFQFYFLHELQNSSDVRLSEIATKSLKETAYHLQYSGDWMIRLGDGTEESHSKMNEAVQDIWIFADEAFEKSKVDELAVKDGYGIDLTKIKSSVQEKRKAIMDEANLQIPDLDWHQSGGKVGKHTEHMGYILSDLQFLQRAYPNATW